MNRDLREVTAEGLLIQARGAEARTDRTLARLEHEAEKVNGQQIITPGQRLRLTGIISRLLDEAETPSFLDSPPR